MVKKILVTLVLLAAASSASAATIGVNGVSTTVAPGAAGPLQCVLDGLVARGYPVRFIRGHGRGSVRRSLHPSGYALDVNQVRRGVTVPRMPADEIALAASCGVVSGASWDHNDSGHFQVGGWTGRRAARRAPKTIELNFLGLAGQHDVRQFQPARRRR